MAGFPSVELSLAVLWSNFVVLDVRSVSSLLRRARNSVGLDRHSTTNTKLIQGCVDYTFVGVLCNLSH